MEIPEDVANVVVTYSEKSAPWMKLIGIISIISGVISVIITMGIGILFAWVPVWLGVILLQAGSLAKKMKEENKPEHLAGMLKKLKLYFLIGGIVSIIAIVFMVIGLITGAAFLGGLSGMHSFGG